MRPNREGKISNTQLLELDELKYCPFRSCLIRALGLKEDISLKPNKTHLENKEDTLEKEKRLTTFKEDKLLLNNNYVTDTDRRKTEDKVKDHYINNPLELEKFVGDQNINFTMFCKTLKVFNPRAHPDIKIKCKKI